MAKSRNRKEHKAKVQAYRKRVEDGKKSFEKKMRQLYEQQQQDNINRQISNNQVDSNSIEGIDVNEFKLDEQEPVLSGTGIVEGITSPEQV